MNSIEMLYQLYKKYYEELDDTHKDEWWGTVRDLDNTYQFIIFVCDELQLPYPKEIQDEIAAEEERKRLLIEQGRSISKARQAMDRLIEKKES